MGYGTVSLIGGIVELIARSIVAIITTHYQTFFIICMGYPAAWLFAAIFFVITYYIIMSKYKTVGILDEAGD